MADASDGELVALFLAGNERDAFPVLVDRYYDAVLNLAYRMLGNFSDAQDVTQEVFLRVYRQAGTYKPSHPFSTWVLSITSHLVIDTLRRPRFLSVPLEDAPFLDSLSDADADPAQAALESERRDELQAFLQRLPVKYRSALVLRYWYDLSHEEIAAVLDLTAPLVKSRLHRGRELLARAIGANAPGGGAGEHASLAHPERVAGREGAPASPSCSTPLPGGSPPDLPQGSKSLYRRREGRAFENRRREEPSALPGTRRPGAAARSCRQRLQS
jgi:RNA polymerase sigma factor (sigma-70 family)